MANRMTRQTRENIAVAVEARTHEMSGGVTIELVGAGGRRAWVCGIDGPLVYGNRDLARRAVTRINSKIRVTPQATI